MIIKPTLGDQLNYGHWAISGLVFCPLFNEGCGSKILDLSGNGNTATFGTGTFTPIWASGKFGPAVKYDSGTRQHVVISHSPTLSLGTNDFTISIWFNSIANPTDDHPAMIGKGDTGAGEWMCRLQNKENVGMYLNAGDIDLSTSGTDYADDQWHHAVFVRYGDNLYIYVDGILAASGAGVGSSDLNDTTTLKLGNADGDAARWWDGLIDIPMIWNGRALSASEIVYLYMYPFCMFERNPIELWVAATSIAVVGAPGAMTLNTGYWGQVV